jgi:hypothetical protein
MSPTLVHLSLFLDLSRAKNLVNECQLFGRLQFVTSRQHSRMSAFVSAQHCTAKVETRKRGDDVRERGITRNLIDGHPFARSVELRRRARNLEFIRHSCVTWQLSCASHVAHVISSGRAHTHILVRTIAGSGSCSSKRAG